MFLLYTILSSLFLKFSQLENSIQQFKKFPYNQHNLNWQIKKMKAQKKYLKKVLDKIECAMVHFGGRGLSPGGMKRFASHK